MCKQIASTPALEEDTVIRLSGDAGRTTKSDPDTKVASVIQRVVSRALAECCRVATFYSAAEDTAHKYVPEPPSGDIVAVKLFDASSITVPVAKFVKHELEKNFFDKFKA